MTVEWGTAIRSGTEAAFIAHHELPNWSSSEHTAQAGDVVDTPGDAEADAGDADADEAGEADDAAEEGESDEADDACEHAAENVRADYDDDD